MADELTPKQLAFVTKVVCESLSYSDAYRAIYDCKNRTPEQVSSAASSLARSPKVAAKISALQRGAEAAAVAKTSYTLADAIKEAEDLRAMAVEKGQVAAATQAASLKAKLAGHLIDRKEIKSGPLEDTDVEDLEALLAELKRRKAAEAGGKVEQDEGNRPEIRAH
jgi:hypothetical protein